MSRPRKAVDDPVRKMLRERGASSQAVRGGLEYLLRRWRDTVAEVERMTGTPPAADMDEYLNDIDARQLLQDALAVATGDQKARVAEEVAALDERFRAATKPVLVGIWGAKNAAKAGWTAERNWWYFRVPRNAE